MLVARSGLSFSSYSHSSASNCLSWARRASSVWLSAFRSKGRKIPMVTRDAQNLWRENIQPPNSQRVEPVILSEIAGTSVKTLRRSRTLDASQIRQFQCFYTGPYIVCPDDMYAFQRQCNLGAQVPELPVSKGWLSSVSS